ncbi:MAG: ectonucleotide pyrophosphatase/phosphodiesterase [Edaphobacter sp.]
MGRTLPVILSFVAQSLFCAVSLAAQKPHVLMISLDGMKPEYVSHAKEHGLKLPVLERFLAEGSYAEGVIGVIPTVTYPSHSTMVTGVWPTEHGIYANNVFDPVGEHPGELNGYFRQLKVLTLYEAAERAGLTTAAIGWPVTVGAPTDYLVAEFGRSDSSAVPPGDIVHPVDLKDKVGASFSSDTPEDDKNTAWSIGIISTYNPNLVLVHLSMLDHQQHLHSPFSPEADQTVEKLDQQVGQIIDAELRKDAQSKIVIVSDHGFVQVDHNVLLNVLFAKAGFITLRSGNLPKGTSPVESWEAEMWEGGGAVAVMLRNPSDTATRAKVKQFLDTIAADPQYGINKILSHEELVKQGGYPNAAFLVDFKPGWSGAGGFYGAAVRDAPSTGTHGYLPEHPEMRSTFMVMGAGVAKGRDLGLIDMRQIAPSVASMLGIKLPAALQQPVHYQP